MDICIYCKRCTICQCPCHKYKIIVQDLQERYDRLAELCVHDLVIKAFDDRPSVSPNALIGFLESKGIPKHISRNEIADLIASKKLWVTATCLLTTDKGWAEGLRDFCKARGLVIKETWDDDA